jgi:hypothetical protein
LNACLPAPVLDSTQTMDDFLVSELLLDAASSEFDKHDGSEHQRN